MCAPKFRLAAVALASLAYVSDAFPNADQLEIGVRKSKKKSSTIKPDNRDREIPSDGFVRRQKQNEHLSVGLNGLVRRQNTSSASSLGAGGFKKVALLFRGESFRAVGKIGRRGDHFGAAHRRTCEDESAEHQERLTRSHKFVVQTMISKGIMVDVYGATYACQNGQDYANRLPQMMPMKAFEIIPKDGSFQLNAMSYVLRMALATGEKYDGIYILRWDYDYNGAFTRMNQADCFVDRYPRIWTYFEGPRRLWNGDAMIYVPGHHANQMLAFMEQDSSPCCLGTDPHDKSNRRGNCAQSCVWCVREFLSSLKIAAKGACSPCLSSEDCAQSLDEENDGSSGAGEPNDEEGSRCR